jgi:hypothetical protein
MGFLSGLGDVINDQLGTGENTTHSLDSSDGVVKGYGKLGSYAQKIDQSAERSYIEDGFIRNFGPRLRNIIFQEPDVVIVIKKRMFSSLINNHKLDLLEEKEQLVVRAAKKLFQNKCRLISAYERLIKVEKMTVEAGTFNTYLGPMVLNSLDALAPVLALMGIPIDPSTQRAFETLRRILAYSEPASVSGWTNTDWDSEFGNSYVGEGPGTFELTVASSISTTTSTELGEGKADLTFEDPYNLMSITEQDIDQALTDASNLFVSGRFFKFTEIETQNRVEELKRKLALIRANRGASNITIMISEGTLLSQRVRAVVDEEGIEIKFTYNTGVQEAFKGFEKAKSFKDGASSVGSLFSNGGITFDPLFVVDNAELVKNREGPGNKLTQEEAKILADLIKSIYSLISFRKTSQRTLSRQNAELNYARNRLRMMFNGRHIIQPMDVVNIFITTKTYYDEQLTNGFKNVFSGTGNLRLAEKFDSLFSGINNSLNQLLGKTSYDDLEKNAIVGPEFPMWLWRMFKNDITKQAAGTCVFVGICTNVSSNYSAANGKFNLNVSCKDNAHYFELGQVNFQPAADVFNSSIYDPLTPFDVSFDAATGAPLTSNSENYFPPLLPQNQTLLQTGKASFRTGPNKGEQATPFLYGVNDKEYAFNNFNRVLNDPAGLVYRWKQGIQTITKFGRPSPVSSPEQERSVVLTDHPFAGQDMMNVLSSLITGEPYNYVTFLKAAIANGNSGGITNTNGSPPAQSFLEGLMYDLQKNNAIWGNFVPFKKLVIPRSLNEFIAKTTLQALQVNNQLSTQLRERAKLMDEIALTNNGMAKDPYSTLPKDENGYYKQRSDANPTIIINQLKRQLDSVNKSVNNLQNAYMDTIKNAHAPSPEYGVAIIGSNIDIVNGNQSNVNVKKQAAAEDDRRRKLHSITQRRLWDVKANTDKNLFIVDDQYDNNLDLQAFERKIGGKMEIFSSTYATVMEKIKTVKSFLGLEVFANTQGHIEVRPPQYNKIPSSVFYRMFRTRDETGFRVFPEFLESLYFNQLQGLFDRIEIVEDHIRLRCIALGATDDRTSKDLILKYPEFAFITDENTGKITEGLRLMIMQAHPDLKEGLQSEALKTLDKSTATFSAVAGVSKLFDAVTQAKLTEGAANYSISNMSENSAKIRERLRSKTGQEPPSIVDMFGTSKVGVLGKSVSQVDRLAVVDQLATFLSERQEVIKSATNAMKNLKDGLSLVAPQVQKSFQIDSEGTAVTLGSNGSGNFARSVTTPFLAQKTGIPQPLRHMIEYEQDDEYGPGSGNRYIIKGSMYSSLSIRETPPKHTMISVTGLIEQGFVDPPSDMNTSSDGNGMTTAYAVDYDMWYMYGFRVAPVTKIPFFGDPKAQCAPFAIAQLLQNREEILSGTIEMNAYNEFYQPGDVVYIEDKNLLFYVRSVSHKMNEFKSLSTTLELTYGHSPGEYLPNMLDVVGKVIYNAKGFHGAFRSDRYDSVGARRPLGVIIYNATQPSATKANTNPTAVASSRSSSNVNQNATTAGATKINNITKALFGGAFGTRNKGILSNIMLGTSGALNQMHLQRTKAYIVLRYYSPSDREEEMLNAADAIKQWLVDPTQFSQSTQTLISGGGGAPKNGFGISEDDIIIERVDLDKNEYDTVDPEEQDTQPNDQGPSSAAWSVAWELGGVKQKPKELVKKMSENVIDVFIAYYKIPAAQTTTKDQTSQSGQASAETVIVANRRG